MARESVYSKLMNSWIEHKNKQLKASEFVFWMKNYRADDSSNVLDQAFIIKVKEYII